MRPLRVCSLRAAAVFLCGCVGWMMDAGGAPLAPDFVHAYSGPKKVFVEWAASPDYDLKGYDVWRTRVDDAGQTVGAAELVQAGWRSNEIARLLPAWPHYYQVRTVDLSGAESELSPPSEIVDPGKVTLFVPHIRLNMEKKPDLHLRIRTRPDNTTFWVLRIPFAVDCAYDLSVTGLGIVASYSWDVPSDADGLSIKPSGVAGGLYLSNNLDRAGEIRIATAAANGRPLYGAGTLFNAYVPLRAIAAASRLYEINLLREPPDGMGTGTRFYDVDVNPVDLVLQDGSFQVVPGAPLHGDANGDGVIDGRDPEYIIRAFNGLEEPVDLIHDINLDGVVDAADAIMIQRWIGSLPIELLSPVKADSSVSRAYVDAAENFHPAVGLGPLKGNPGDTVEVPLTIDSGAESAILAGFSAVLTYPAGEKAVVEASAAGGDALPVDAMFSANNEVDGGYGTLRLSASMKEGLSGTGAQTLAVISFALGEDAPANTSYPVIIQSFETHDEYGQTPRHGAPGQVAKSGIITGAVIATLVSAKDGSPINTATVRLEALGRVGELSEDNTGLYAFPGVPDGSYTVNAVAQGHITAQVAVKVSNAEIVPVSIPMQHVAQGEGEDESEEEGEGEGEKGFLRCGPVDTTPGGVWSDGLALVAALGALAMGRRRGRRSD